VSVFISQERRTKNEERKKKHTMKKPTKKTATTITTRDELERAMGQLAQHTIARSIYADTMDKRLTEVRAQFEERLGELDETIDELFDDLNAWAVLHPDEFASKKSLDLTHGTLGFRTTPPALKPAKGVKWDHVLDMLKCRGMQSYVRQAEEVNKEMLLQDRETIGTEKLARLGLEVRQDEKFYAEPKLEAQV
jgi:phage host-nuclease inhibitor protein Gam